MTTEELKELAATLNAGNHAGTVEDPIPQQLLYTKTAEDGTKKVYTPAGTIIIGGGSGGSASPATDTVMGIVKLTDDASVDAPAAMGSIAMTPNGVKTYVETKADEILQQAKDYTDQNAGGGGTLGYVVTPTITTPTDSATNVSTLPTIAATPYKNVFGTEDPRAHRVFQVSEKADFSELILDENVNADSYQVTAQLSPNKTLYARVKDVASSGYESAWSTSVSFTTAQGVVADTPIVTLQGYNNSPTDIGSGLTIVTSAYSVSGGVADTHKATSWSISTRDGARGVVWQSLNDTTNKTSIVVPAGTLAKSTAYRLSVTFHGTTSFDSSPAVVDFTTSNDFGTVNAPTLTVQGGPNAVYETPLLTGGAFSNTREQDAHDKTDWEILDASGVSPVWQSLNNVSAKTTITVPKGTLQVATAYKARVRYHGVKFGWSAYTVVDFSTVSEFTHIATPTLTCSDGTENVYETPTIVGSAFTVEPSGSDTHTWTTWEVLQNGTTSVYKLEQSASALTTLNIPSGVLKVSQSYTVTCVYNGATYGASDVGRLTFTTADAFTGPKPPVITISPNTESFTPTSTIKAEPQYINGDYEPDKAEWEILPAAGGEALYQSGEVTTYAGMHMLYPPFGSAKLAASTNYKVRCRQHYANNEQGGTWSQWAELNFQTNPEYTAMPEWGRIHFKVGAGGGTFKQSDFRWWDGSKLQITINGSPNSETTISLNENDDVIIHNVFDKNYPDVWFKPMNPSEILEPLPLLTLDANGSNLVTDFGGDVGVEQTGSNRNTATDKYGLFAQCSNLTTLCEGLFRNNPQVYCFGAMGGGGGGGGGSYFFSGGGEPGTGGNGGGHDNLAGKGSIEGGHQGRNGYGTFYNCVLLSDVKNDLFNYSTVNTMFLCGYGGGGGGNGADAIGGNGGNAFGVFYNCKQFSTTDFVVNYGTQVAIFGAAGGNGGGDSGGTYGTSEGGTGSPWATNTKIAAISDNFFRHGKLVHKAITVNGSISPTSTWGYGGGSGYYGGGGGGGDAKPKNDAGETGDGVDGGDGCINGGQGGNVQYVKGGYAGGGGGGGGGCGQSNVIRNGGGSAYNSNPSTKVDYSSQYGAFEGCTELTEVPEDLFGDLTIESLCNTFKGCTKLTTVPQNLLAEVDVKLVNSFFEGCIALNNADVRIKYNNVLNAENFSKSTPTKTIVRVPAGSNTVATFQNDASSNTNVVLEAV